ncbi:hypothetical protein QYF36_014847 [Acer negundo]|nr:hypothetical protein QYF36_014847 [Acer negundo]
MNLQHLLFQEIHNHRAQKQPRNALFYNTNDTKKLRISIEVILTAPNDS